MSTLVSVVVPCFNLGPYLDETVQSVLDQSFQDFEIIIVDDGSDAATTRHMLASYRRPKTRILRTDNRGVAKARNRGLEEAVGRYVSFLDADDLYEPTFLERTVEALEAMMPMAVRRYQFGGVVSGGSLAQPPSSYTHCPARVQRFIIWL